MRPLPLIALLIICIYLPAMGSDISVFTNQTILHGQWQPTHQETSMALEAAILFVQKTAGQPESSSWPLKYKIDSAQKISEDFSRYAVQFTGKLDHGKKIIVCNFFPAAGIENEFKYWKTNQVAVDDGGPSFWNIKYEVQSRTCSDLQINGEA